MGKIVRKFKKPEKLKVKKAIKKFIDKQKLSSRQIKYRINRRIGMGQVDAAAAAGYSESYARARSARIEKIVNVGLIEELNRAGATDKEMARAMAERAKNVTKKIIADEEVYEVPDENLRQSTWETIAKLKKHLLPTPAISTDSTTRLIIVLDRETKKDAGSGDHPHEETNFSVRPTH